MCLGYQGRSTCEVKFQFLSGIYSSQHLRLWRTTTVLYLEEVTDTLLKDQTRCHLTKHPSWLNLGQGEGNLTQEYYLALSPGYFPCRVGLVHFHSCGVVASQRFILGWKVNNDCLVAKSNGHFSVINLLDLSVVFDIVDIYLLLNALPGFPSSLPSGLFSFWLPFQLVLSLVPS